MSELQLERPTTSQRPDGVVPDPPVLSEFLPALEQTNGIRNTQQRKEATRLGGDTEIRRNGSNSNQTKILPNNPSNGSVNGIGSKNRDGHCPEARGANKSQMKLETVDGNVPHKSEIGRDTEGNNSLLRGSAAYTLVISSFNRDVIDASSPKANGPVDDDISSTKADAPIPLSIPIPNPLQTLESTKQAKRPDPRGLSPAHRANVLATEDNGKHATTATFVEPQPSLEPTNKISDVPIGSRFADAHAVTGEPMVEVAAMKKVSRIFWPSKNRILNGLISRTKDKGPAEKSLETIENVDFVELDGLKLVKGKYPSAKDYNTFKDSISDPLVRWISTITFYGPEAESATIEELKMICDKTGQVMPCIVIACASQRRADDIKKQLKAGLRSFELYGLHIEVVSDPKRFGYLFLPVTSNGEPSAIGNRSYFATTWSKNEDCNVWDRYAAAPIFLFSEPIEGEPARDPSHCLASCTLGGFIEIASSIYGLTVAHPLVNAIAMNQTQMLVDREPMSLRVGNIIACVLSSVSPNDNTADKKQYSVQSNSDWALIELDSDFDRAQWEQSGMASYSLSVQREELEVLDDADLEPRKVVIQGGFSSNVKGKLSIARSRLQIGLSRFSVMCIELEEDNHLVAGDSGSFVILDGKVCGMIIAGRDSLNLAYMIPITDTFQSIAIEYGGLSVNFPNAGAHQQPRTTSSQLVQKTPSGKPTAAKPTVLPVKATEAIDQISSIPPISSPSSQIVTASHMAELPTTFEKSDSIKREENTKSNSRATVPHQSKREAIIDPREDSSDYLPPSYALVNSPPSISDVRIGSIVPDVHNPGTDAQGGPTSWDSSTVRSIVDSDFRMATRYTLHGSKRSWFSTSLPEESHDIALSARKRERHELIQPTDQFWELMAEIETRRNILRLRERFGKKLYFIIGLVSLDNAKWTIAKKGSKVTKSYAVSAALGGISAGVDHHFESEIADEQLTFVSRGVRVFAVEYREIRFPRFGQGAPKLDTRTRWQVLAGDLGRHSSNLTS